MLSQGKFYEVMKWWFNQNWMSNLGSRTCTSSKATCSLSGNKVDINHYSDWHRRGIRLEQGWFGISISFIVEYLW